MKSVISYAICSEFKPKEGKGQASRKAKTRIYKLRKADGQYINVCGRFFLNTLGLKANNDKMICKAFETESRTGEPEPVIKD